MRKTTQEILTKFLTNARLAEEKVKMFLPLNYHQLNWRPGENRWSIAECFEHLIRTNEKYIPEFQKYSSGKAQSAEIPFKHTLMGKFVIRSITPEIKRKYRTRAPFNPIGNSISRNIVSNFLDQHNRMVELVKNLDHNKFTEKLTSPFYEYVKYNIGDGIIVVANHDLRHLNQAERVLLTEGFPS